MRMTLNYVYASFSACYPVLSSLCPVGWMCSFLKMFSALQISAFYLIVVSSAYGQISTHPVVLGRLGTSAVLTCHSKEEPLRLCIWEQKESDKLIATFDTNSSSSSPPTSVDGSVYAFYGEGLDKGQCGIKIEKVQGSDLQRWKCTLVSRDNSTAVYRGTVLLQGAEILSLEEPSAFFDSKHEASRPASESRNFNNGHGSVSLARPIVTAEGSVSIAPVHSHSGGVPVQEVEVQSAGLFITPRRKDRKLVIL